ncbi:hypothetical protein GEMRC1_006338 [Eukaryota sp. GEM-RC1]
MSSSIPDLGSDFGSLATSDAVVDDATFLKTSLSEVATLLNSPSIDELIPIFIDRPPRVRFCKTPLPADLFPPLHFNKLSPWNFWKSIGSPTTMLAPMVRGSELAFRLLTKKYNTQCRTSPMLSSRAYLPVEYNSDMVLTTSSDDDPLIIQVAGFDPVLVCLTALKALSSAPNACAIELNCGCPQRIARRGYYGAYLQDNIPLIQTLLACLDQVVRVPVIVKIRRQNTIEETIRYASALVDAGASVVTLHCRTREQRGVNKGNPDWEYARELNKALSHRVPVVLNGGIACYKDVREAELIGCAAIMAGEWILSDPAIFADVRSGVPGLCDLALEFIDICSNVQGAMPTMSTFKSHLVSILTRYLTPDGLKQFNVLVEEKELDRKLVWRDQVDGWKPTQCYYDCLSNLMDCQTVQEAIDVVQEVRRRIALEIDGEGLEKKEEEDCDYDIGDFFG